MLAYVPFLIFRHLLLCRHGSNGSLLLGSHICVGRTSGHCVCVSFVVVWRYSTGFVCFLNIFLVCAPQWVLFVGIMRAIICCVISPYVHILYGRSACSSKRHAISASIHMRLPGRIVHMSSLKFDILYVYVLVWLAHSYTIYTCIAS